jgi:hypothetical protein
MNIFGNKNVVMGDISGSNIHIGDTGVTVDGELITFPNAKEITVIITGDVTEFSCTTANVTVNGNINEIETTTGNVTVSGDVTNNIKTSTGNVKCGKVGGNVKTTTGNIRTA